MSSTQVVAVLDCGTSAVRGTVAEVGPDGYRILEELRRDVDLRHVFRQERLRRGTMDAVVEAVGDLIHEFQAYQPAEIRAVATAGIRVAANADVLLERIQAHAGIAVEIIDADDEARLYHGALAQVLGTAHVRLQGDVVLADMGSGATIVSRIKSGKLAQCVEEHFGILRLLTDFRSLQDSPDFLAALDRFVHGAAAMMVRRLYRLRRPHLVVTGQEVRALARLVGGQRSDRLHELVVGRVEDWLKSVLSLPRLGVAERLGCSPDEAVGLVVAGCLIVHLSHEANQPTILVPELRLRDGLIADLLPGAPGPHALSRPNLLAAARQLATRFGTNVDYARNTANLVTQLFDQTVELHRLGKRERILLEFAAWVHDIGAFVNARSRHKHTAYIIQSSDIAGLSDRDKDIVASVARYHRRSSPQPNHAGFQSLPRHSRVVVNYLAALLRLAYALDVERAQRIKKVHCTVDDGRLLIRVDRRQITLERWSLQRRANMFSDVFGLDVAILPREA